MNGILIINKPKNFTSHDVVAKVKKICKQKVGHTGTLDPNATGVLPLLIGKATLISKYLINHDKEYVATLKLGIKTDTADGEGNIVIQKEVNSNIDVEKIKSVFSNMIGKQKQIPPMYSAIKVNGKKLYEYARKGETVKIEPREIELYNLELIDYNTNIHEIIFKISCSKGTYIRTVCEDIAEHLETVGYMKELKRTKVGIFNIESAINIEELDENNFEKYLISIDELFSDLEDITIQQNELKLLLNGVKLDKKQYKNGLYKIYNESNFIGIGTVEEGKLKRDVII